MRNLVVLGAGTAGTMVANRLVRALPSQQWTVTVVDPSPVHRYQPGLLFLPFGTLRAAEVSRPTRSALRRGVRLVAAEVDRVDPAAQTVHLPDGTELAYDYLVIATGTSPRPHETPGLAQALGGRVHEFFTHQGALALAAHLADWKGGRLVVHVTEMPIKCPVAPLEFVFLAEAFLTERGLRDQVEIVYATPLPGAFTKPISSAYLGRMLTDRGIALEPDFVVESVDGDAGTMSSFDGRVLKFDLLVTVPVNMGADYLARSGLGDELNYVTVDRHTLQSPDHPTIFALGDATDLPSSKAGSVAHFQVDSLVPNLLAHIEGRPMTHSFDGHANCFIETGHGKALLVDFSYDTEPLPGAYPLPVVGPMRLLAESRVNHWGKLAFRWIYWNVLLPGRRMPVPSHLSMTGKRRPSAPPAEQPPPRVPVGLD